MSDYGTLQPAVEETATPDPRFGGMADLQAQLFDGTAARAPEPRYDESPVGDMTAWQAATRSGKQAPKRGRGGPPRHTWRHRRSLAWIGAVLGVLVVLVPASAAGYWAYTNYPYEVKTYFGWHGDWSGAGHGSTEIEIKSGEVGADVAATLARHGVVKTDRAFYQLLLATTPQPTFLPGTYKVPLHASSAAALAALEDSANRVTFDVAIPEGSTVADILAITAASTGISLKTLQHTVKDYTAIGVPSSEVSAEGWLFPATYSFQPGVTATSALSAMVTRMKQALDTHGVPVSERHRVLTLAGLVQKEGNGADDAKVARVFTNRLAAGMALQSDATVSYGAGGTTVVPTAKEYAAKNGYNTYLRTGLPIGPISNPGDTAISAALHPAPGKWLYFVTVNLATGKTVFSTTDAEHEQAAAQFQKWLAANPSYAK